QPQAQGHLVAQAVAVSEAHADVSGDPLASSSAFAFSRRTDAVTPFPLDDGPSYVPINCIIQFFQKNHNTTIS
ncbi:hypothetical protein A2U01_0090450, partial [Trifolium medium]|nr:hypothetical protein [Trifolium medium]